jgi:two-component system nitrogen regulation response regulator GlnG/two-component system response regulator HydG
LPFETLDSAPEDDRTDCAPHTSWALAVAAWEGYPERVGEVLLLPQGETRVFGREDEPDGDGDGAHARLVRQRPGRNVLAAPIDDPFVSREQLRLTSRAEGIDVENVGKRRMLIGGGAVPRATVRDAELLELGRRVLFVVVRRPAEIERVAGFDDCAFGEPDADGFVGESPAAWRMRAILRHAARDDGHVLVVGESGTGKDLAANAIHRGSARARRPLVVRNAATIPAGIADAELFGNVANYPNVGMRERPGLLGEAEGGTLFLDEIGEMSEELQAHLLRVLQAGGDYQRLGDARRRDADVRIIAATNRPLDRVRHDLLARFRFVVRMPPLRARREDIPLLARHVARRLSPLVAPDFATVRRLMSLGYTTHVREIEALLSRADAADDHASEKETSAASSAVRGDDLSREAIVAALERCGGQRDQASRELGLSSRHVLKRLMKKRGVSWRRRALVSGNAPVRYRVR